MPWSCGRERPPSPSALNGTASARALPKRRRGDSGHSRESLGCADGIIDVRTGCRDLRHRTPRRGAQRRSPGGAVPRTAAVVRTDRASQYLGGPRGDSRGNRGSSRGSPWKVTGLGGVAALSPSFAMIGWPNGGRSTLPRAWPSASSFPHLRRRPMSDCSTVGGAAPGAPRPHGDRSVIAGARGGVSLVQVQKHQPTMLCAAIAIGHHRSASRRAEPALPCAPGRDSDAHQGRRGHGRSNRSHCGSSPNRATRKSISTRVFAAR